MRPPIALPVAPRVVLPIVPKQSFGEGVNVDLFPKQPSDPKMSILYQACQRGHEKNMKPLDEPNRTQFARLDRLGGNTLVNLSPPPKIRRKYKPYFRSTFE